MPPSVMMYSHSIYPDPVSTRDVYNITHPKRTHLSFLMFFSRVQIYYNVDSALLLRKIHDFLPNILVHVYAVFQHLGLP